MMFVALAMFVRIFGKKGFVVAAFNQADQFCRTFRTFYLVAGSAAERVVTWSTKNSSSFF